MQFFLWGPHQGTLRAQSKFCYWGKLAFFMPYLKLNLKTILCCGLELGYRISIFTIEMYVYLIFTIWHHWLPILCGISKKAISNINNCPAAISYQTRVFNMKNGSQSLAKSREDEMAFSCFSVVAYQLPVS